ncbi:OsmC family protein [Pseudalkalibacillus caeni]|uniref:OsmC family protein n=1 Tax=Exobacillus caeni TaxID=2574798 RepID=A0A5R9F854_9BACL|nr:OsmC family protein [Pseudalkalibacillus caeni]TLS37023.1 OsmC family protein [Pseudalkalibacillus caeni]
MTIKANPDLRKIEVDSLWKKNVQTEHLVRGFRFLVDEPVKIGGDNEAPTPLDYVVGAFNGCILVVIDSVGKELGFQYKDIEISSEAWVDRRGLKGTADVSPYYQTVRNKIVFYTEHSNELLIEVKKTVQKRCPLYNLLKDAGVEVELDWSITGGS